MIPNNNNETLQATNVCAVSSYKDFTSQGNFGSSVMPQNNTRYFKNKMTGDSNGMCQIVGDPFSQIFSSSNKPTLDEAQYHLKIVHHCIGLT